MKHSAYPKYKPSGVEWLGDVPVHWDVKRLKNSAHYCVSNVNKVPSENEIPVRLCNYTDVYYNDFITSDMELMETTATQEEIEKFHLQKEDVVITKDSEEWDDIAISSLVIKTAPDLICGYHLAIIRPKKEKLSGRYLSRLFQSSEVNHQLQVEATGVTRYGLPKSAIGEALVPLPPFSEQLSIANFLDCETGRIDTLICKKQRFVELLKEKRTALISRAVTKGLNPKVKMKSSGVEWLGDAPVHWEVKKLKFVLWLSRGVDLPAETFVEGPYPVYASNGMIGYHNVYTTKGPCVVVGRSGSVGEVNYVEGDFWAHNTALYIQEFRKVLPRFSYYLLLVIDLKSLSAGSAVGTLNRNYIHDVSIALPPLTEQQAIAAFLDRETGKIDALMAKVETAIETLKEYRSALISAAVTGKIDVSTGLNTGVREVA